MGAMVSDASFTENVAVSFAMDDKMPELKHGYDMAKIGDWDEAITIFQSAVEKYKHSRNKVDKAYYNLGLGYMVTNQFDEARENFEIAYRIQAEDKYARALQKLDQRIEEMQQLQEQL